MSKEWEAYYMLYEQNYAKKYKNFATYLPCSLNNKFTIREELMHFFMYNFSMLPKKPYKRLIID